MHVCPSISYRNLTPHLLRTRKLPKTTPGHFYIFSLNLSALNVKNDFYSDIKSHIISFIMSLRPKRMDRPSSNLIIYA